MTNAADQKLNSGYRNSLVAKQQCLRERGQGRPDVNPSNDFHVIISGLAGIGSNEKSGQHSEQGRKREFDVKGWGLGLGINV